LTTNQDKCETLCERKGKGLCKKVTTNIDTIDTIDSLDNNINKENLLNNNLYKKNINKENLLNNNLYKNNITKETKNPLFEICKISYKDFNMKNFKEINFNNYDENNSFVKDNENLIKSIQDKYFSLTGKTEYIQNILRMIEYIKKSA